MKTIYAYPGSFCPPTFGHLSIVKRAAEFLPEVIVVCSENSNKSGQWFSPQKCKELWKTYELPRNVKISTLGEFLSYSDPKNTNIVLIRGIRDESDMEQERQVMALNKNKFGIDKYLYILSDDEHKKISSTKARMAAQNLRLEELSAYVSPLVISALLEKTLDMKNIFMVVGRPGSGKSTFLRMLAEEMQRTFILTQMNLIMNLGRCLQKVFPAKISIASCESVKAKY
jgi:pantetheine-phosphate adenylyltransferase